MVIFALSYNMLMGQAGLLSFCHAVSSVSPAIVTVHPSMPSSAGALPVPMELMPLVGGLGGLVLRASCSATSTTKQRATAFAMITLGIGELVAACALMFQHFFGGEGGVNTDRDDRHSLFGLDLRRRRSRSTT